MQKEGGQTTEAETMIVEKDGFQRPPGTADFTDEGGDTGEGGFPRIVPSDYPSYKESDRPGTYGTLPPSTAPAASLSPQPGRTGLKPQKVPARKVLGRKVLLKKIRMMTKKKQYHHQQ